MSEGKAVTHVIKCKCMSCSLHFENYSFNAEWMPQFCPECGQNEGRFLVWKTTSDEFIFMHVPGEAQLVAMGLPTPA